LIPWLGGAEHDEGLEVFGRPEGVYFEARQRGAPIELGTNIVSLRSDGQNDTIATLTAKTVPIPIGALGFGLAIAGAVIYDPGHQTGNGFIVNVPVSFEFNKSICVNVSALINDGDPRGLFATEASVFPGISFPNGASFPRCSQ
jgi:hypothetical protein